VELCVVDAAPELHAAKEFQLRIPGQVYLARYQPGKLPPLIRGGEESDPARRWTISADRTALMDALSSALREQRLLLPADAASIPGFFAHLRAPVRRVVAPTQGVDRAVYEKGARDDHYFHATLYAVLADHIYRKLVESQPEYVDLRWFSSLGSWDPGVY
jgi:hypothetical protein